MDDDIKKRNTDCVYFLASPLTCKKGIECEYRHSEVARLNPRDCYYWLAGNCLNPTCAFRHPPLERPETLSGPAAVPQQSSLPVNKVCVPCYFYFNGFCNKGDRCTFLHGSNDVSPTPSIPKTTANVHLPEIKTSTKGDTVQTVVEAPSNPSRIDTSKSVANVQFLPQKNIQQSVTSNVVERSPYMQALLPDCEEELTKSDTPLPVEDFNDQSLSPEQQSSEEQVEEEHIEREEWWESSPGLDVLVDNGSEGYEDEQEYLPMHDGEVIGLQDHLLQYEYEDPVGYDAAEYPGVGILYEDRIQDMYNGLKDENMFDNVSGAPKPSMHRNTDPFTFQKKTLLPREVEVNCQKDMDLRDRLRKRRRVEGHHQSFHNPRRYGPSFLKEKGQERPRRHHMGHHSHLPRLASEVGRMIGFENEKDLELNGVNRRSSFRQSETSFNKSRQREMERRRLHLLPSEVSLRDRNSRKVRGRQHSTTTITTTTLFTGPKTLAQIKEEKWKARETRGENFGNQRRQFSKMRTSSRDFEGPKPLSEILKGKKRLGSVSDDSSTPRTKKEHVESGGGGARRNHVCFEQIRNESWIGEDDEDDYKDYGDDDDDEGGLEKKLASIYS